jgi:voltage-gated potassium channel
MAAKRLTREENTSPRLEAYVERSQTALDIFALCTLWIIAVPVANFGEGSDATLGGLLLRLSVSVVFAIDMAIRSALAPQRFTYLRTHPLGLLAVVFPPVRVLFSLRLITSLFRRGHIERFMAAAGLLLFNGVLIVYFYERNAPGANITSLGNALWWAVVTVSTVGYGDMYPVTLGGRITASGIMAIGILTLAVITAQVSSSYVDQAARRRAAADGPVAKEPADAPLQLQHLTALHDRLDRIESQLRAAADAEHAPATDED